MKLTNCIVSKALLIFLLSNCLLALMHSLILIPITVQFMEVYKLNWFSDFDLFSKVMSNGMFALTVFPTLIHYQFPVANQLDNP